MAMIEARGLTKTFGDTEALSGIDLTAERGKVLGVLGPNGAGKTTAVRILATLIRPDHGTATIDGVDVLADPDAIRARIGLTGQYAAVDERLTAFENLEHVGRLFHMGTKTARIRADELLERFDLADAGRRVVSGYSGGMRRRLDIAMSLVANPTVLFLDEPTTGLDPRSRLALWEVIEELTDRGTTTLLTTQYLDEADRLADDIAVIDRGRVIAEGTPVELKRRVGGDQIEVTLETAEDLEVVAARLAPLGVGEPVIHTADVRVAVPVDDASGLVPRIVRDLDDAGITIRDVGLRRSSLDDVFFALTGRAAEPEEEEPLAS